MTKTIELHNDVNEVPLLAEWVEQLGDEMALEMPAVFQLNLALEEAVVNVMNYAFPGETGRSFYLSATELDGDPDTIEFVLEDSGIPFDPTQKEAPDITLSAEDRDIGGLGIFLVYQFMEKVDYKREDDKNILIMTYKKNKAES